MNKSFFLHGQDSSGKGTKGRWFTEHFPGMSVPDFEGDLNTRLTTLITLCHDAHDITFVGSSFGGLMATCFAMEYPDKCRSLILLAPALNFPKFSPPAKKIPVPTTLIIGRQDTVTPPDIVLPLAKESFSQLTISTVEDDHRLHTCFEKLDWLDLLKSTF